MRITDLSNNLVSYGYTDQYGKYISNPLNPGTYLINISYSNYLSYSGTKTLNYSSDNFTHLFVPDIIFVTPYSGNKVKIDKLMNISDRVYFLDSQASKTELLKMQWILDYANFIYIDMYMTGKAEYSYEWFIDTPANKKR
ncbi:carboxypeptidase-like regulatory domain-containing protein [Methanobrevibacter arboriphilus]|uniref:carboxypeptidase-like regulatory domain-containing protein n=1 Tax=Methanobrevibacter arboriphilus TaxID=39441 RepID=UPI000B0A5AD2|nr:carboxypeptidase-like regulatory domain-containing protein [Methanobrevibacter arboriphilus]